VLNFGFISNIGGIDSLFYQLSETREAEQSVTPIIYQAERCGLDSSFIVFPADATGQIAIVRREIYNWRTLSWIGLYRAAPPTYSAMRAQPGSFFYGCGGWLSGNRINGQDMAALLSQAVGLMRDSLEIEKRPEEWNIRRYADSWIAQCAARARMIGDAETPLSAGEGVSAAPNLARCCIDISEETENRRLASALDLAQTAAVFNAKYSFAYISDDRAVIRSFQNLRRCDIYERTRLIQAAPASPAGAGASAFSAAVATMARQAESRNSPDRSFTPEARNRESVTPKIDTGTDFPDLGRRVLEAIYKVQLSLRLSLSLLIAAICFGALLLAWILYFIYAATTDSSRNIEEMRASMKAIHLNLSSLASSSRKTPDQGQERPFKTASEPARSTGEDAPARGAAQAGPQELTAAYRQLDAALNAFDAAVQNATPAVQFGWRIQNARQLWIDLVKKEIAKAAQAVDDGPPQDLQGDILAPNPNVSGDRGSKHKKKKPKNGAPR
jgi:hypothetical protein